MPPASISATASRVPSATSSGPSHRDSAGQIRSCSQLLERQIVGESAKQAHGRVSSARSRGPASERGSGDRAARAGANRRSASATGKTATMRPPSTASASPSSATTCGSTRTVQRGQIRASIVCIGRGVGARERASKYSRPTARDATERDRHVLDFTPCFLGTWMCRSGDARRRITGRRRCPANLTPRRFSVPSAPTRAGGGRDRIFLSGADGSR